jgi:hypothetical protein
MYTQPPFSIHLPRPDWTPAFAGVTALDYEATLNENGY